MPTYEYACKSCGEHLEVVQSFKDDPLTDCPSCGGSLRKVFGAIGIAFKGSGFYKTDSRPAPKEKSSDSTAESKPIGDSKSKADGAQTEGAKTEGAKTDSSKKESKAAASS